ncbi:MAG: thioredoxin family protein [Chloroflexota bacterium]|nr:thioredoxin family protein [Chloroflexota bacterium]MDQ2887159.1 thioredoxin family protein [Chloroflexota bacterium]
MADNFIDVTGDDFAEKVTGSAQTVVVLFSAPQSNACQIQEPEIAAISKDYQGRVTFARLNVEGQQELTDQYHIEGVPTLIFFKGGQELHRIKGIMMRDKLKRQLEGVLLAS